MLHKLAVAVRRPELSAVIDPNWLGSIKNAS